MKVFLSTSRIGGGKICKRESQERYWRLLFVVKPVCHVCISQSDEFECGSSLSYDVTPLVQHYTPSEVYPCLDRFVCTVGRCPAIVLLRVVKKCWIKSARDLALRATHFKRVKRVLGSTRMTNSRHRCFLH